jgi:16S rRNA (uracil1498-N3)-methyltransferase
MSTPWFYSPTTILDTTPHPLNAEETHHALKVLRLHHHAPIILFDGKGTHATATLDIINKNQATAHITEITHTPLPTPSIHLGIACLKPESMDWLLEKTVELGINTITPLMTEHVILNKDQEQLQKKYQKWQKHLIGAAKQSHNPHLPTLQPITRLQNWLHQIPPQQNLNLLASLHPPHLKSYHYLEKFINIKNLHLLIGPEGDFSNTEETLIRSNHFHPIDLGIQILRSETAALKIITESQLLYQQANP